MDKPRAPVARSSPQPPSARHVAIICDGSGRWARARGLSIGRGHEAAADTVIARLRDAIELGVHELTLYTFSTENWTRPAEEVRGLMSLLAARIEQGTRALEEEGVRIRFIGRRERVSTELLREMARAEDLTCANRAISLFIAVNYGGRAEIVDAAARFAGTSEEEFHALLYAPEMHDPEVIIRTGGERRLSNYLLWQSAYAELVFRDELWPDFTRAAFELSLAEFVERRRRFGGR
jgi:undecaprenyl diphosphate synthase